MKVLEWVAIAFSRKAKTREFHGGKGIATHSSTLGEGNGTPLQYTCLENPMDRGAGGLQSMGLLRGRHD